MHTAERNSFLDHCEIYDAGFVQCREWMLYQIRYNHYPCNLGLTTELKHFDGSFFQKLVNLMVARHEILRTTLSVIDGRLKQVVHRAEDFQVGHTFFDLSAKTQEQREKFIADNKVMQYTMPFNFEYGPMFRISVFKEAENRFSVFICFHHVIFDTYSIAIFRRDANILMEALTRGTTPVFPNPVAQYRMYASLENRLVNTGEGETYKTYWREQLDNKFRRLLVIDEDRWNAYYARHIQKVAEVKQRLMRLPFYDLRFIAPVVWRYSEERAGVLRYAFSTETFRNIQDFRSKSNSSLLALVIAGFLLTLNRLSGQEIFMFYLPGPRKVDGAYKDVMGWLATGGVVFFDLKENTSPRVFLDYIDQQLFLLSSHSIYPFEALDYQSPAPLGSLIPGYLSTEDVDDTSGDDFQHSGVISHDHESSTCYQDITLFLSMGQRSCSVNFYYNNFLFTPQLSEQIVSELEFSINRVIAEVLPFEVVVI